MNLIIGFAPEMLCSLKTGMKEVDVESQPEQKVSVDLRMEERGQRVKGEGWVERVSLEERINISISKGSIR